MTISGLLLAILGQARAVPEMRDLPFGKKQPLESLNSIRELQREAPAPEPHPEDDPKAVAKALDLPADPESIAAYYMKLANSSGGRYYEALDRPLLGVLERLLHDQLVPDADVVFVIDHTSSMEDDIAAIASDIQRLVKQFEAIGGIRVGIATFSDVKSGQKFGFCTHRLSDDYSGIPAFLQGVQMRGTIEDSYGAIWKTVDQFDWQSKRKRLIVLISDDKPAMAKNAWKREEDVYLKCAKSGVATNIFPVLVDKYSAEKQ